MNWFPYPTGAMALLTLFWAASFLVTFGLLMLMSWRRPRKRRTTLRASPHVVPNARPSA